MFCSRMRAPGGAAALVAVLTLAFGQGATQAECRHTPDMPPAIRSLREVYLPRERYAELAEAWRRYVDAHPKSAYAHVQYARAIGYSNYDLETQTRLVRKARDLDAECAQALAQLAQLTQVVSFEPGSPSAATARELASRAIELAPDWYEPHIVLLAQAMVAGDRDAVGRELEAIRHKGGFPSPLLDFGYNMLVSASQGAVLLTNGDNDTFPLLALQAIHGVRRDVQVVNLSLLNVPHYARTELGRGAPFEPAEIESLGTRKGLLSRKILEELCARAADARLRRPLRFAATVPRATLEAVCPQEFELVGMVYGIRPQTKRAADADPAVAVAPTDSLLTQVFRLESANDFAYPWGEESSLSQLLRNYVGLYWRVARLHAEAGDLAGLRRMLRGSLTLLQAHPELRRSGAEDLLRDQVEYWKKVDPHNPEVGVWEKRLDTKANGG